MRPIDAEVVIGRYYADWEYHCIEMGEDDRQWLKQCIEQAPTLTLDDIRPKGRWNIVELDKATKRITIECSECGMAEETSLTAYGLNRDFCPSCGADMIGG